MSTLPKVKVKSHKSKVLIKAGTLPHKGGSTLRVSSKTPLRYSQPNVQHLRYTGKTYIFNNFCA